MNYKDIINAYLKIRRFDNTIPDEVLDFMKDAAIEKLQHKLPNPQTFITDSIDNQNSGSNEDNNTNDTVVQSKHIFLEEVKNEP